MSGQPIADIMADPAGDIISPRIQYLEQWIRDCQRYNRNVSAQLTANYDRIRDMESLLAAKNAELRKGADRLAELDTELAEARERANRWAYKMTLLVGWVKANCTPEQAVAARTASQVPE